MYTVKAEDRGVTYTTGIDLNATGTTDLYDPDIEATVYGVFMENGGSTAEVNLEITDGSSTAVLAQPGAGNSLEFTGPIVLDSDQKLQLNVTTAEGSAETADAVTSHGEQEYAA